MSHTLAATPSFVENRKIDLFDSLLFLFFVTLHADQLSLPIGGFTLRINNLIGAVVALLFVIRFRNEKFKITRALFLSLSLLTISFLCSFLFSPFKDRCAVFLVYWAMTLALYFFFPYFLWLYMGKERVLRLYYASFITVGVYSALQLLFSLAGFADPFVEQRIFGDIARPNAFAYEPSYYALYFTPFVVICNLQRRRLFVANALYLISATTTTVLCYLLFFLSKPKRWKWLLLLGILAAPPLFSYLFVKSHSYIERLVAMKNCFQVFLEHPIFGVGLGALPSYLFESWSLGSSSYMNLFSEVTIAEAQNPLKLFEPSNITTEILASLGLFGSLAILIFLFVFYRAYKSCKADGAFLFFFSTVMILLLLQLSQGLFRPYLWTHIAFAFAYFKN